MAGEVSIYTRLQLTGGWHGVADLSFSSCNSVVCARQQNAAIISGCRVAQRRHLLCDWCRGLFSLAFFLWYDRQPLPARHSSPQFDLAAASIDMRSESHGISGASRPLPAKQVDRQVVAPKARSSQAHCMVMRCLPPLPQRASGAEITWSP